MIKGILIDVNKGTSEVKELDGSLQDYYKATNCDCIDIVTRKIEGNCYSFVVDDNGWLKEESKIIPSVFSKATKDVELVGNVFICNRKREDLVSLNEQDIELIDLHTFEAKDPDGNLKRVLIID